MLEFSGTEITAPVVFAGGASKGSLWGQILADILEREVRVPVVRKAPALGCGLMAAIGAGDFASVEEAAAAAVRFERTFEPAKQHREAYRGARERWLATYPSQKALVDAGVTTALWRAPGV